MGLGEGLGLSDLTNFLGKFIYTKKAEETEANGILFLIISERAQWVSGYSGPPPLPAIIWLHGNTKPVGTVILTSRK